MHEPEVVPFLLSKCLFSDNELGENVWKSTDVQLGWARHRGFEGSGRRACERRQGGREVGDGGDGGHGGEGDEGGGAGGDEEEGNLAALVV